MLLPTRNEVTVKRHYTINELDTIVLTRDVAEHGLQQEDIGAVVHCYQDGAAFEVESVTAEGQTVALLTLSPAHIRLIGSREILHTREVVA